MLESTQRPVFHHYIVFIALKSIFKLLYRGCNTMAHLVLPEDTTGSSGDRQLHIARYERLDLHGDVKAVFWIAVSIILSLLIGKLN